MKKTRIILLGLTAAATALLAACTDTAPDILTGSTEAQAPVPVVFDTYLASVIKEDSTKASTRADNNYYIDGNLHKDYKYLAGTYINTEIPRKPEDPTGKTNNWSIGVFGYYHDNGNWSSTSLPNYMYNQPVEHLADGSWEYSPVKYWPNELGTDGDKTKNDATGETSATSSHTDKLSFWAYYPYNETTSTDESRFILPNQDTEGFNGIEIIQSKDVTKQKDFLISKLKTGITKQGINDKVKFEFTHAATRVFFRLHTYNIASGPDQPTHAELTVKTITLKQVYSRAKFTPPQTGDADIRDLKYWCNNKNNSNENHWDPVDITINVPSGYGHFPEIAGGTYNQHLWPINEYETTGKKTTGWRSRTLIEPELVPLIVPQYIHNGSNSDRQYFTDFAIEVTYDINFTYSDGTVVKYTDCKESKKYYQTKEDFRHFLPGRTLRIYLLVGYRRLEVDAEEVDWTIWTDEEGNPYYDLEENTDAGSSGS